MSNSLMRASSNKKKNSDSPVKSSSRHGSIDRLSNQSAIIHTKEADKNQLKTNYEFGRKLGQGGFGTVRLITEKSTGTVYAMKVMKKTFGSALRLEQLEREVSILKLVDHPFVIHLKEVYETPQKVYMIMEYCERGELVDTVRSLPQISENQIRLIMYRLASAIAYLHDVGVVHRDLKPENILLRKEGPNEDLFDIRVSDFGLANYVGESSGQVGTEEMMENTVGTSYYIAPEVFSTVGYSKQCDIWSVGIVMYLLFCKFDREYITNLKDMILAKKIEFTKSAWENVSSEAKHLIQKMLLFDPAERASAKEILNHPWMKGQTISGTTSTATVLDMMRSFNAERKFRKIALVVFAATILVSPIKDKIAKLEESSSSSQNLHHGRKNRTSTPSLPDIIEGIPSQVPNTKPHTEEVVKDDAKKTKPKLAGSNGGLSDKKYIAKQTSSKLSSNDDIPRSEKNAIGSNVSISKSEKSNTSESTLSVQKNGLQKKAAAVRAAR